MAKKRTKNYLDKAKELADVILYQQTGGVMGTAPGDAVKNNPGSFVEMKGLLDMMLRIHALELKGPDPDEETESAFDIIKKEAKNGGKKAKSGSFEAISQRVAEARAAQLAAGDADPDSE